MQRTACAIFSLFYAAFIEQGGRTVFITGLMVVDAIIAVLIIVAVILQPGRSAGLGAIDGGADALFGGKVKGMDLLLYKATMALAVIFGAINILLAKLTIV
jgi:preprotein translocase subunit SecG